MNQDISTITTPLARAGPKAAGVVFKKFATIEPVVASPLLSPPALIQSLREHL